MSNKRSNKLFYCWRVRLLLIFAALLAQNVLAEPPAIEEQQSDRLRIGLVLGGGGARGAAHIGVLKELERLHIPIDAIAGTSMGAIVGGLYATGMNAEELEQLVSSLDWSAALSDQPAREDLSFRRKQDERDFPINLELGVRGGELLLPKGVIQGQKLDLLLRELTLHASQISDFDDLPIPFRAIAADIVTGDAVVMRSGDLTRSIRASMSVPAVFAPAAIDGRLLVDGGTVGNLPIDVMKRMDVDVVIAVDVEFPLYKPEELNSVLTISEQMLTIMIRKETLRQIDTLTDNDVLIRPELGTYASANFDDITETIGPGSDAVAAVSSRLTPHSLSQFDWQAHLAARKKLPDPNQKLAFVRVIHDDLLDTKVLESKLRIEAGDDIDTALLARNANRLYGLELYEHVAYRLVEENGETGVEYKATAKSWGPNTLQFGVSLQDDFEGSTSFNLAARLTKSALNKLGAEWRTDMQLGTEPALVSEFYQPLSFDSRWFVAPRVEIGRSNLNTFLQGDNVARYRVSEGDFGVGLGRELGTIGEFRVGAFRGAGNARVRIGDPSLDNIDFDSGGVFARLRVDSMDASGFPRKGTYADVRWSQSLPGLGADYRFDIVEGDFAQTWSKGKSSLQLGLSYATTLSSDNTVQDFFPLGGFLRLSGLEQGEISGPHAGLARLVYYRRVGSQTGGVFDTPIYLGVSAEAGNVWQTRSEMDFSSMQVNGSIFAGLDTYIGPIYLAAGFGENGQTNFYLFIGATQR
jgi:NTE family protein